MTMQLSRFAFSFPHVLYATGMLLRVRPDSRVKDGIETIVWDEMKDANRDVGSTVRYEDEEAAESRVQGGQRERSSSKRAVVLT